VLIDNYGDKTALDKYQQDPLLQKSFDGRRDGGITAGEQVIENRNDDNYSVRYKCNKSTLASSYKKKSRFSLNLGGITDTTDGFDQY
jgi:hypothetical protein